MHSRSEGPFFVIVDNRCCFKFLSVRRRAGSPGFGDFLPWKWPESVFLADQKKTGFCGRDWRVAFSNRFRVFVWTGKYDSKTLQVHVEF